MANYLVIDVITGPCPGPGGCIPTVTANNANICQDDDYITITGTCFDTVAANNVVVFNLGAAGVVSSATSTSLTVYFTTSPTSAGALTAIVTNGSGSSAPAVQVATVIAACGPNCLFARTVGKTYNSGWTLVQSGTCENLYCQVGELIVVKVCAIEGDYQESISVTWNGQTLTLDKSQAVSGEGYSGRAMLFSTETTGTATSDVVVTVPGSVGTALMVVPVRLVGSSTNAADVSASKSGTSSVPNTGSTGATAANCEIAEAVIMRFTNDEPGQPTWYNGLLRSEHLSMQSDAVLSMSEGWRLVKNSGTTVDAAIYDTAEVWADAVVVYR